jgi:CNT family concentrative nucleoside transporter
LAEIGPRLVAALGVVAALALAWVISLDRSRTPWRVLGAGLVLQFFVALLLLKTALGSFLFRAAAWGVSALAAPAKAGSSFVFGATADGDYTIAFHVLPTIVFLGSLFAVLDYFGLIRLAVRGMAAVMGRALRLSGAESLAATANIFLGMIEAPLCIRPYLAGMTRSELFTVMAVGMATVAGSVLVVYAELLGVEFAGHLVTASLIAAPGGVMIAKIIVPERETPATAAGAALSSEREARGAIDAAAQGAVAGLRLAA